MLAGSGAGKTAALAARMTRLIQESPREVFPVLCLTFTNKAAAEIQTRLENLSSHTRDRILIITFHSFTTAVLRQHSSHFSLTPNFEIINERERLKTIKSILVKKNSELSKFISPEQALKSINFLFHNAVSDSEVSLIVKDQDVSKQLQTLFIDYKQSLIQRNCLDYDSTLYFFEKLLRERPRISKGLHNIYKYICVDEFQDVNIAQFRIMRTLAPDRNSNIFITSDDNQAIYQWNGENPSKISELEQFYNIKTIQLPENYKCPATVVEVANSLINYSNEHIAGENPLLSIKSGSSENSIKLLQFEDDKHEYSNIARLVENCILGGTQPIDIVILARTSSMLSEMHSALKDLSIPSYLQTKGTQFESAPLRLVISALKLALVRFDEDLASTVAKSLADCIGDNFVDENLSYVHRLSDNDYLQLLGTFVTGNPGVSTPLQEAIQELIKGNYQIFIQSVLSYFDTLELALKPNKDEWFPEYASERNIWQNVIKELGGEDKAYALSLEHFLEKIALADKTSEVTPNAVRCFTIHGSKGMDFKHVYLIGLVEDKLPSFQSAKIDDYSPQMQEERHSCFAAMTRATESLTLSYARRYNGCSKKPSRFLTEMGFSEVEPLGQVEMAI
jgi:DNA helicase-2/ATP-dependent DNA helicase PcrA